MLRFELSLGLALAIAAAPALFPSCASAPATESQKAAAAAEATDECLTHPEMSKGWGECNVKETIFAHKKALTRCQKKFQKTPEPGQTLSMNFQVMEDGHVQNVKASPRASAENRLLESCLAEEIGRLKFAPPPAGTKPTISFPLQLN